MPLKPVHLIAFAIFLGVSSGSVRADDADVPVTYPHVTELETYILGQTFTNDALADRIARMEKTAFGAVSDNPDLSARTDALTDYADTKLGKRSPVATDDNGYSDSAPPAADSSSSDSAPADYPHINTLEQEILGEMHKQDPLPARLARMEVKAFGAASTDPDLSNRTDALDAYAQKQLHKPSFDKQQAQQAAREGYMPATAGGGASKGKQVLNFLGNQLLGMAVPIPGLANTAFAGVRATPAQGSGSEEDAPRPPEDPAIFQETPPPPGARMITQVGWCEMRVFGHTSPQLHLSDRLEQLNLELHFAPNQKGAELMDDMPKLMQAAQARKPQPY